MARLWSSGFELNTETAGVEQTNKSGTSSIDATIFRSGSYAKRFNHTTTFGTSGYTFAASAQTAAFYARAYLYITTTPSATRTIMTFVTGGGTFRTSIRLTTSNELQLFNAEDNTQIGSNSSALSTDTWYRIELGTDTTTLSSTAVEGKLDGATFASGTANLAAGIDGLWIGATGGNGTTDIYFDDIAINDSTSSSQNSWPGEEEIIHLRPNAAGDNATMTTGTGSTFAEVDEVTPDDVTTYIHGNDVDELSDFNIDATPAALASDDVINCVQVGVRAANEDASASANFVLRIKATSGGTVEESAAINPPNTTWFTNKSAVPRNYSLTLYDLPGASTTEWTKTELDTAQIGVRVNADDAGDNPRISTLWLLVGHKPAAAPPAGSGAEWQQTIIGSGFLPFYA